ncbi:MAG: hypothetical protein GKR88_16555 [Flavobacteriaceae bacterium]|nr:MAG: hypothetical protein GKR88_16555 [Flavobacteriaceae bacterium]
MQQKRTYHFTTLEMIKEHFTTNKRFAMYFIFILFFTVGCYQYEKDKVTITIINELNDCEEDNIHYKILEGNFIEKSSIVNIEFSDRLNSKENNELFFPAWGTKRLKFEVSGYFSKKTKKQDYYSCDDVFSFKVIEILNIEDITAIDDYKINNQE